MIESVSGVVQEITETSLRIKTGPVVLEVMAPGFFLRRVSSGQAVDIPVYLHLQLEGNRMVPMLVGFPQRRDREFFLQFISVSGVGVKAAIRALARPTAEIAGAIASGDSGYLTTLPGVGPKRAKQIIAGLQDLMQKTWGISGSSGEISSSRQEATAVLRQLGIPPGEAERLLAEAQSRLGDDAETSALVKSAMQIRSAR